MQVDHEAPAVAPIQSVSQSVSPPLTHSLGHSIRQSISQAPLDVCAGLARAGLRYSLYERPLLHIQVQTNVPPLPPVPEPPLPLE